MSASIRRRWTATARILRRPAPAHRHRPRHRPGSEIRRSRRADFGAGPLGAGADRDAAARPPAGARLAYLFISHDLKVVRALANHVVVMQNGRVVEEGPADTIFANPRTDYTRTLFKAAFALDSDAPAELEPA